MRSELLHQVLGVVVNRGAADVHLLGNRRRGFTFGQPAQHFYFSIGQLNRARRRADEERVDGAQRVCAVECRAGAVGL